MNALWIGSDLFKAYHDPSTGRIDVVASRFGAQGEALASESGLELYLDEEGTVCAFSLPVGEGAPDSGSGLPRRPVECPSAVEAEVDVALDAAARWSFDPPTGTLRLSFEGIEPERWGRLGDNLVWLALDGEARLAAVVVEGVSRDPGGRGQLAWLDELGVDADG